MLFYDSISTPGPAEVRGMTVFLAGIAKQNLLLVMMEEEGASLNRHITCN